MEEPRNLVLGTAGHIDHGKTALVRALTGVDTDRLPAEKLRGITIDLGFAALDLGACRLAIVDVPGHERFIRNMLAGASGLDLALLVVAADDSVMPQTREHLEILKLLGLAGGLLVLTKCDLADPGWLDLVEDDIRALIAGTFLEGAPIVRVSAVTGRGLDDLRDALRRLSETAPAREDPGPFRLAIDRAFTVAGHGTVVTGTVGSGSVAVGDDLEWLPAGKVVRVRGLQRHDQPVARVDRGTRAAINLAGVHHAQVQRGQELAAPGYLRPTRALSVALRAAPDAPRALRHRMRYRLHLGTAEVAATLALLEAHELAPGGSGLGQLFLSEPVVATYGQPFVLREVSPPATLGGGRVLQPDARRVRRRDSLAIARLVRLQSADPAERLRATLAEYGLQPWTSHDLCRATGIARDALPAALDRLSASDELVELRIGKRSIRVPAEVAAEREDRVLRALGRLHAAHPRLSAVPRARVASALADLDNDALVACLIDRLHAQGKVVADARAVALSAHEPKLSQADRRLKTALAEAIRAGGFSPPDATELLGHPRPRAAVEAELLALLCEEDRIIAIGLGLYLDADVAAELRQRVAERLVGDARITMAALRDLLGTTRKYAVPIGEYLDRIGLTIREGDVRRLGSVSAPPAE